MENLIDINKNLSWSFGPLNL